MYKIAFSPPDITESEIKAVEEVLRSGWITTGPKTKLFEEKISRFCGTNRAVCLNSATAAMELTLRLLGVGPGDEVITSAYTYSASCSVIYHVGARPILIDTQADSFEMDYDSLESAVTSKTKAIIPVDIAGIMCDYEKLSEIVNKKSSIFRPKNDLQKSIGRVAVISDSAHGFGAKKKGNISGSLADFTCFSFHAVKNLTTAEGGAVVWREIQGISDDEIYKNFMLLSLHGQTKDALAKTQAGSWEYDILYPAYKCNMTDIMAALGLAQLAKYSDLLKRRREIVHIYDKGFSGENLKVLPHLTAENESSCHLYMARALGKNENFRNALIKKMAEKGVPTNVHYKPLPMLTAYKNLGFDIKNFPNSYKIYENEITLPLHTLLTNDEIYYIINTLKSFL